MQGQLDKLDDAFIQQDKIDQDTYERQRDRLREEVALAKIELHEATLDELDVEGILGFAEHVVTNAAHLWTEASLDQKQRLQQVLFPEGLVFDGERFGTAVTCLAFSDLGDSESVEVEVASHAELSWNQAIAWLRNMAALRENPVFAGDSAVSGRSTSPSNTGVSTP